MRAELGVHIDKAVAYAQRHALDACVIWLGDKLRAEIYTSAFAANDAHPLYSGTKSFWGPAAILAQQDGILSLDELVTETVTEWRGEKDKKTITVRMLLSLTAGFGFGGLGASVPTYDRAIAAPLKNKPGAMFTMVVSHCKFSARCSRGN